MTSHDVDTVDTAAAALVGQSRIDGKEVLDVVNRVSARLPLAEPAEIEVCVRREFRRHETDRVRQYTSVLVERTVTALLAPRS